MPGERRQHDDTSGCRHERKHDENAVRRKEPVCLGRAPELMGDQDTDDGRETHLDGEGGSRDGPGRERAKSGRGGTLAHRHRSVRTMTDTAWTDAALEELRSEFGDAYRGRTVLVTGADGFMGSHLTDALVELGADVHAFVRATSSGALNNIGHLRNRLKVHFATSPTRRRSTTWCSELKETRPTGRTSSISAPRRTSASRGTGRTRP